MEPGEVCGNCKYAAEKTCGHCWTPALYCTNEKSDVNLRHSIFEGRAACKKWAAKDKP